MTGLVLSRLAAGYRGRRVLSSVDAVAGRGLVTALIGPNGAGKSTLLRTIAGLQPAAGGTVHLDGDDLLALPAPDRARRLAVVLSERFDAGLLTVDELVALGRHPHTGVTGRLRAADHTAVDDAVRRAGAGHLRGRRVAELSDGERQRVLVARALAQGHEVLLLDEPGAHLDVPARLALLGLLRAVAVERGAAVVVTSHDLELVLRLADHVWLLSGTGLVEGVPEELTGAVGDTFDTDDLAYDVVSGTFLARDAPGPAVAVRGDEEGVALASRLLTREGFAVAPDAGEVIEVRGSTFRIGGLTLDGWPALAGWARVNGARVGRSEPASRSF